MAPDMTHDELCEWAADVYQVDGSILSTFCTCDPVRRGRLDGLRLALASVDLGGRAAARILKLIEERET